MVDTDPQENIRAMIAALASLSGDLGLQSVLDHVAEAACRTAGARRGEIALAAGQQHPGKVVTIEIRQGRARRCDDRIADQDGRPLEPGTFLSVPIRVRGDLLGHMYLAQKAGADAFSVDDEGRTTALAALAGAAIQNAMLAQDTAITRHWLEAALELSRKVLDMMGRQENDALRLIADRARDESGSAVAAVGILDAGTRSVRWLLATGPGANAVELDSAAGAAGAWPILSELEPGVARQLGQAEEVLRTPVRGLLGPGLLTALGFEGPVRRVLLLARGPGAAEFKHWEMEIVGGFALHVSMALDLGSTYRMREQHLLFVDRERIARDLHDRVIQRLFAAGLSLQGMRRLMTEPAQLERIKDVVSELDQVIRELRDTIHSLRAPAEGPGLLSSRVTAAVRGGAAALDYTPQLKFAGPVDDVPASIAEHAVAVVLEGLSNAVRHSGADSIRISVVSDDHHQLVLTIADNGRGLPAGTPRSGLANMERRARLLDGSFSIDSAPDRGTRLVWTVPLP